MVEAAVNDEAAFPTRATKINALLKEETLLNKADLAAR